MSQRLRKLPNLCLAHSRLLQGAVDGLLARCNSAGTVIVAVIGVRTVNDHFVAFFGSNPTQVDVQLVLAEVATIGRIRGIVLVVEFVGFQQAQLCAEIGSERLRSLSLEAGQRRRDTEYGEDVLGAQSVERFLQEEAAINATGERHKHAIITAQDLLQTLVGRAGCGCRARFHDPSVPHRGLVVLVSLQEVQDRLRKRRG